MAAAALDVALDRRRGRPVVTACSLPGVAERVSHDRARNWFARRRDLHARGARGELNSMITHDQVALILEANGIAKAADGKPLASPEMYAGRRRHQEVEQHEGQPAVARRRAYGRRAAQGHRDRAGRMFNRGATKWWSARSRSNSRFRRRQDRGVRATHWTVVGEFEAGGSVFESEIWADVAVVQGLFRRANSVRTVRARD